MLVVLCAEVQQDIYRLVEDNAKNETTASFQNFVATASKRLLRSVQKGDLAGFLAYFSPDKKSYFNESLDEVKVTLYNNAVQNRHNVAHSGGSNMTLAEVEAAVNATVHVLEKFQEALCA